jgi:hypothetical protein
MDNEFVQAPARVGHVFPDNSVRTHVLLGAVPAAVEKAVRRYGESKLPAARAAVPAGAKRTLRKFYGPRWAAKLAPLTRADFDAPRVNAGLQYDSLSAVHEAEGGAADDLAFDEADLAADEEESDGEGPAEPEARPGDGPGADTYTTSRVVLYPDDLLEDVRAKIYAVTKISPFKQHLAWWLGAGYAGAYRLTVEGELIEVDPRELEFPTERNSETESPNVRFDRARVLGLPIDERLLGGATAVEALDLAQRTNALPRGAGGGVAVWVLDADAWLGPRRTRITAGVEGDTIRRGFVEKFWPALSLVWTDYLRDPGAIRAAYPKLDPPPAEVRRKVELEQQAMDTEISGVDKALAQEARRRKLAVSVRTALLAGDTGAKTCDLVGLFNGLRLSPDIPAARLRRGPVAVAKVFGTPGRRIMWPAALTADDCPSVVLAVAVREGDVPPAPGRHDVRATLEQEQSRFLFIRVDGDGNLLVRATFPEDREQRLAALGAFVNKNIGPGVDALRAARGSFAPDARGLRAKAAVPLETQSVSVRMRWVAPISEKAFAEFRRRVGALVAAGIARPKSAVGRAMRADFVFEYVKGAETRAASRECGPQPGNLHAAPFGDADGLFRNGYAYLTDAEVAAAVEASREIVRLNVSNRLSDLAFAVSEVPQDMFLAVYSSMLVLLWDMHNGRWFETLPTREIGRHRLRRLQAVDPNLYNLKRYGAPVVYSRLCQTQYQPLAFSPEEAARLSAKERARLVKLRNFTTGDASFYSCPNPQLANLAFIIGKHPLGYCLPCCAKSLPVKGSPRAESFARCLAHGRDERPPPADKRHVMTFGRDLEAGRVAQPPADITEMLYDTADVGASRGRSGEPRRSFFLVGVPQNVFGVEQGGLWSALAFALGAQVGAVAAAAAKAARRHPQIVGGLLAGGFASSFTETGDAVAAFLEIMGRLAAAGRVTPGDFPQFRHAMAGFAALAHGRAWDLALLGLALPALRVHLLLFQPRRAAAHSSPRGINYVALCSPDTRAALEADAPLSAPLALAVMHPDGVTFPVALLDPVEFGHGRGAEFPAGNTTARLFQPGSNVVNLIRNMFKARHALQEAGAESGPPTAQAVLSFLRSGGNAQWRAVKWWRAKRGVICAVTLSRQGGGAAGKACVYLSLAPAGLDPHALENSGGSPSREGSVVTAPFVRGEVPLPVGLARDFVSAYNSYAGRTQTLKVPGLVEGAIRAKPYARITIDTAVTDGSAGISADAVGVGASATRTVMWIDAAPLARVEGHFGALDVQPLGAPPEAIARVAASEAQPRAGTPNARMRGDAAVARYNSLLYGYVTDAVARDVARQRDKPTRRKIAAAVAAAGSAGAAAAAAVRAAKLADEDADKIRAIARAHANSTKWRAYVQSAFDAVQFDFDRAAVLALGGAALLKRVARRDGGVSSRVRGRGAEKGPVIAVPDRALCGAGADDAGLCRADKLAVPPDMFEHLAALLDEALDSRGIQLDLLLSGAPLRTRNELFEQRAEDAAPGFDLPVGSARFVSRPGEYIIWPE